MNDTFQKDEFTTVFNQGRQGQAARQNEETPIDRVALSAILSPTAAEKLRTRFVRTDENTGPELSAEERVFLDLISEGLTVSEASLRAGISRHVLYRRRNAEYPFQRLWDEALDIAGDRLEEEADRRGFTGWEEAVYHKGAVVGVRRRYSDRMLMFRLRALKPGRYSRVRG
jgi:hypothetical protein